MKSNTLNTKNLIIGAGLSGLSFAYFSGKDYLILEQDSTPGGYCRTIPNRNYVWDYAGHFYHFKTEKYKNLFLSLVEPAEIIEQTKSTKIFYKDRLIDYPFQTNIHELEKSEFIDCLRDLYFREEKSSFDSFLDMLYAKFGKSITEKFLKPYNEKLYATALTNLDKEAMGRFFPYADFDTVMQSMSNIKKKTYNDSFLYLKQGTGYFIDKLFAQLDQSKIFFNEQVISVDTAKKLAKTSSGKTIHYENLINTAPLNHFLQLLPDERFAEVANCLSYNKVLVLNLGFDRAPLEPYIKEHWVYFPDKSLNFYRIGFYSNILNSDKLSVYVEIGFPKKTDSIDTEKELSDTLAGMERVGIIDPTFRLVDKNIILMDPAYVHISSEDEKKIQDILSELEKKDIYSLGRYGLWTYNCMEDCIELADNLVKKLCNHPCQNLGGEISGKKTFSIIEHRKFGK